MYLQSPALAKVKNPYVPDLILLGRQEEKGNEYTGKLSAISQYLCPFQRCSWPRNQLSSKMKMVSGETQWFLVLVVCCCFFGHVPIWPDKKPEIKHGTREVHCPVSVCSLSDECKSLHNKWVLVGNFYSKLIDADRLTEKCHACNFRDHHMLPPIVLGFSQSTK